MTRAGKQPICQPSEDYAAFLKGLSVFLFLVLVLAPATTHKAMAASADEAAYTAGLQAVRAGDNRKAIALFSQAIQLNPRDFRYYNDRGIAYKASGIAEKALEDYSKALAIKPDYPNALNNRGLLFVQQGHFDDAIEDFRTALKYGGFEAKIHTNLGMAYAGKGAHEEAIKEFQSAMTFRPMDPRAFFFMAQSLEKMGKNDQALKMYQVALGVVKNPTTEQYIEKRIVALGKEAPEPQPKASSTLQVPSRPTGTPQREVRAPLPPPVGTQPAPRQPQAAKTTRAQREILRARPIAVTPVKAEDRKIAHREPLPTTLEELDRRSRSRALEKFSANAAEIFRQGMQFMEQADPKRAVIRFEDTLQLERRNKNAVSVAWSMLQAGRAYERIGDRIKAANYLEASLKLFQRLKSGDEITLTLVDMAELKKAAGQKEQAQKLLSDALRQAAGTNNQQVASVLKDMLAGRVPSKERRTASTSHPRQNNEKQASDSTASSTATARLDLVKHGDSATGTKPEHRTPAGPAVAKEQKRDASSKIAASSPTQLVPAPKARGPITWGQTKPEKSADRTSEPSHERTVRQNAVQQTERVPAQPNSARQVAPRQVIPSKPVTVETGVGGRPVAVAPPLVAQPNDHRRDVGTKQGSRASKPQEQQTAPPAVIVPRIADTPHRLSRQERREAAQKRISADLSELKKFNTAGDETSMIVVLERLSRRYVLRGQYDKALHGLTASLALREKLGLDGPAVQLFEDRGAMRQKLSDPAGALEDLSRALVLAEAQGASSSDTRALEARCRVLAQEMGLNPGTTLNAYSLLWKARRARDGRGETDALHAIGALYDKAQKPSQALNYYERSAASVLADKARVYEKLGKTKLAEQAYREALAAFKRLDYSRYLVVLKESGLDTSLHARSRR